MSHMSKIYLLISSLFVCLSINAQDAFDPIFLLSQPHPIIENIDSIIIYTYGPSYLAEDSDTVVVIGSDSVELVLQSKEVRTFPSRGVTVDVEYNKEGEKRSTLTVVQDQDGMVLTQKTEFVKYRCLDTTFEQQWPRWDEDALIKLSLSLIDRIS